LEISEKFWQIYEEIKNFREYQLGPTSEQSLEQRALNNLKTLVYQRNEQEILDVKEFLKILLDDTLNYGTLPDYTMRKIANFEFNSKEGTEKTIQSIKDLKEELGMDYLEKEKNKQKNLDREIIVAIENQVL